MTLFLLTCLVFVEYGDTVQLPIVGAIRNDTALMQSQGQLPREPANPVFEIAGEAYYLKNDDLETVFKYNRLTNRWEPIPLFH